LNKKAIIFIINQSQYSRKNVLIFGHLRCSKLWTSGNNYADNTAANEIISKFTI